MKVWQIWSEGYKATGEEGGALLHGEAEGQTFEDASQKFANRTPAFAKYFDSRRMTYWGCRLFDNETDARKSFG